MTDTEPKKYDLIVIGGGGGMKVGTPCTRLLNMKVAVCEMEKFGGTCLNRGCIPSKMLIHAAEVAESIATSERYNIRNHGFDVDFKALVEHVCKEIDGDADATYRGVHNNPNYTHYSEPAHFIGPRLLKCGEDVITAERIVIAAGSRPLIPNTPGLDTVPYLTSREALRLTEKPKSLIVIGGGYIATELGFYFSALGVDTTFVVRSDLLRLEDHETANEFSKAFRERHKVLLHTNVVSVAQGGDGVVVNVSSEADGARTLTAEKLLVVTGVVPNTDLLGDLGSAGIQLRAGNFIKVDEYLRTTAEGVWAIGDIAGNYLFRHCVNFEGEYLFETEFAKDVPMYPIDYVGMPHAVFSSPQVAGVGETEEQLVARNANFVKGVNPYKSSAMGSALRSTHGFAKLLIERDTHKILGCHIVGEHASVMLHEVLPLMRLHGRLEDILLTIHIHPALNEILRNAARKARDELLRVGEQLSVKMRYK